MALPAPLGGSAHLVGFRQLFLALPAPLGGSALLRSLAVPLASFYIIYQHFIMQYDDDDDDYDDPPNGVNHWGYQAQVIPRDPLPDSYYNPPALPGPGPWGPVRVALARLAATDPYDMSMMQNMLPEEDEFGNEYASSAAYAEASRIADLAQARARAEANRQRALFNLSMSRARDDTASRRAFRPRGTYDTSSNEPRDAR